MELLKVGAIFCFKGIVRNTKLFVVFRSIEEIDGIACFQSLHAVDFIVGCELDLTFTRSCDCASRHG